MFMWLIYAFPVVLVVSVLFTYGLCFRTSKLTGKKWPSGHPWSGITLLLLATLFAVEAYHWQLSVALAWGLKICTAIMAVVWIVSDEMKEMKKTITNSNENKRKEQ